MTGKGRIEKPIGLISGSVKRSVNGKNLKMVKEAATEYKVLKVLKGKNSLLRIFPETGRTHQIRVHLASIGHPIVGDRLYGNKKEDGELGKELELTRQFLHAESAEFNLEDGSRIKIETELPGELTDFLESLQIKESKEEF